MFQERASVRRTSSTAAVVALAILAMSAISATGCGEKQGAATTSPAEVKTATAVTAPSAQPSAAPPLASAAPPAPDEDAPAASALPGAKTFDCGARGQKPCPMQKWMKTVMAAASSSEDGDKLAEALTYVANHPPPGFTAWAALATGGAKKAKAGDLDGAKVSCKQCHDQFKDKYKTTLRDRPF
jgi:hypothetical protein